ncbi:7tm 6 domain containing protein [Asbolus verrucosus]|uniref:Odorant receptor n=1 Tax=Asbolus verrucosus TaxID=1661398 RepID=A0A482VRW6_ASBVE|nr:7tm 6 domain containing protein [Asbolus verrucosus]
MEKFEWRQLITTNILKLKIIGLWPEGESYKPNLYTLWATISLTIFICGHNFFQALNIIFNLDDLQTLMATSFVTLSTLIAIMKAYYVIRNMEILKKLMETLNSDLFQPKNAKQITMIQPSLKFWKINYVMCWTMACGAIFFWSTYPILDNSVKEYRLPFLAWYPYDTKISPYYEITYIYQILGIIFVAITAISVDTLIAALNVYIGAQFDILCDDIKHLYDILTDTNKKLLNCISHHREILKFAENTNNFFNWIVFFQFFISATTIGVTMFQLTMVVPLSNEFFSLVTFGMAILVEIFMYCWFGNEVELKSRKISYAAFESDWLNISMEVKKKMVFFILRSQTPLKMSALNLFYLSLDTFMRVNFDNYFHYGCHCSKFQILRTAWSYFALLQQMGSRK